MRKRDLQRQTDNLSRTEVGRWGRLEEVGGDDFLTQYLKTVLKPWQDVKHPDHSIKRGKGTRFIRLSVLLLLYDKIDISR